MVGKDILEEWDVGLEKDTYGKREETFNFNEILLYIKDDVTTQKQNSKRVKTAITQLKSYFVNLSLERNDCGSSEENILLKSSVLNRLL